MKQLRMMCVVTSFIIVFSVFYCSVYALDQNEVSVSAVWSNETADLGSSTGVTVTFRNEISEELQIFSIGIHFDWMDSDQLFGHNLSNDPVIIPSFGSHIFDSITVQIPDNVSIGSHDYFFGIDGLQNVTNTFFWSSPTQTLEIHNSKKDIYYELIDEVASKISEGVKVDYQNPNAENSFKNAINWYYSANFSAEAEQWDEAVSALQKASNYLDQIETEEQKNVTPETQQNTLLIIVGVATVIIVTVSIIILVHKKQKQSNENTAET